MPVPGPGARAGEHGVEAAAMTMRLRPAAAGTPEPAEPDTTPWWREHKPFLIALGSGFVVRVIVQVAFMPAFIHSDAPTYLDVFDHLNPNYQRPVGYVLYLLLPVLSIVDKIAVVATVQHVLGLATAVILYALLRR